jgi:glycosyltransferase involved in cell wall biosynthesis
MTDRPLDVAILGSRGIPAKYGAFEQCAQRLGEGFLERGLRATVYCPENQAYREPTYSGISLEYVAHPAGASGPLLYDLFSLRRAIAKRHDVMIMLGYGASPFFVLAKQSGIPLICNTDGFEWKRSKWSPLVRAYFKTAERIAARTADYLVSDSLAIQQYYQDKYGVRSTYIAYGTELPEGEPGDVSAYGVAPGGYYIVVMRMEPENSIREIVQGFIASKSKRSLIIVGPPTPFFDREVLPIAATDPRVRYLGPIYDRERLFALRRNAYAYLHGHTVGGTNPSLLEALASGNFVIARDVPYNREVVEDTGEYFDTAADLARVIDTMDATPAESMKTRGEQGRQVALTRFRWDQIVDAYLALVREAAASRKPPR